MRGITADSKQLRIRNSTAEFLIFTAQAGEESIEVRYQGETIWLKQPLMAELFAVTRENITMHLRNIYESDELREEATRKDFLQVLSEGS
ncbi:MAG: cell filamentation protein Fic [Propionibacteriaceae bacterium]|nr:cell filamentation protein Fic [Propionibacteriaceae bacterium]